MKKACLVALVAIGMASSALLADEPIPGLTPEAFGSAYACYPTCVLPDYILAEDLNSDGWLDLAVSCFASNAVSIYLNRALEDTPYPGVFAEPERIITAAGPIAIAAGYVDSAAGADGYADIAVLTAVSTSGSVIQSTAEGFNSVAADLLAPSAVPVHMAVGDMTRTDLIADWVIATNRPAVVSLSINGAPATPILGPFAEATITSVAIADFNCDGRNDIAVGFSTPAQIEIFYALPGPPVAWATGGPLALPGGLQVTSMDVGDLNNDGFPDIVAVGNIGGFGQVVVLTNHTAPTGFAVGTALPTWGLDAHFVEVLDADGNGWDDFAVANYASHTITVFLTNPESLAGDGRHTRHDVCLEEPSKATITIVPQYKIEIECGFYPNCIAAGDFDRNGKMDIAFTLESTSEVICPQNPSCIEIVFDIACGFQPDQKAHLVTPGEEPQECEPDGCGDKGDEPKNP